MKADTLGQVVKENTNDLMARLNEVSREDRNKISYATDELKVCGVMDGKLITLELTNGTLNEKKFFFGTPLGISSEAPSIKTIWDAIPAVNRWDADLALITDNNGTGAEFFQEINKRFVRRPVCISSLTVVTDDTDQRAVSPKKVLVPHNLGDASERSMRFKGVYTEYNQTELIFEPTVLGEFAGLSYTLGAGVTVKMNFEIHLTDQAIFKG